MSLTQRLGKKGRFAKVSQRTNLNWAVNSAGECHPHTVEVGGSNPPPPTTNKINQLVVPAEAPMAGSRLIVYQGHTKADQN